MLLVGIGKHGGRRVTVSQKIDRRRVKDSSYGTFLRLSDRFLTTVVAFHLTFECNGPATAFSDAWRLYTVTVTTMCWSRRQKRQ